MMLRIAIDGACRRNGKPNCIAAGGVFVQHFSTEDEQLLNTKVLSNYEIGSTNQRGELLALLTALDYIWSANQSTQIITDSEYIFNAMTKEWYVGWQSRGWKTALNEPVKNSDLWREIVRMYNNCSQKGIDITFYHIKGHCIPFGKVTANTILSKDETGKTLFYDVCRKYDTVSETSRKDTLIEANNLSKKNNGFELNPTILKTFVCVNVMADAIATKCVEAADALMA